MTPEGAVKAAAKKMYAKHGAKYDRSAQTGMGQNGRADDIVCRSPDGHFIGVEAKKLDVFDVTRLQQIWLDEAAAVGGSSMVLNATNLALLEHVLTNPIRCVAQLERKKIGSRCTGHILTNMTTGATIHVAADGK